jgi:hypothetical protein
MDDKRRNTDTAIAQITEKLIAMDERQEERHEEAKASRLKTEESIVEIKKSLADIPLLRQQVDNFLILIEKIDSHIAGGVAKNRDAIESLDKRVGKIELESAILAKEREAKYKRLSDVEELAKCNTKRIDDIDKDGIAAKAKRGLITSGARGLWRDLIGPLMVVATLGIYALFHKDTGSTVTVSPVINPSPEGRHVVQPE